MSALLILCAAVIEFFALGSAYIHGERRGDGWYGAAGLLLGAIALAACFVAGRGS